MLPSEKQALVRDIQTTLNELNAAIIEVKTKAYTMGVEPSNLQQPDGSYILHPLLIGKASALHALVVLNKE